MALRVGYFVFARVFGIDLPWTISRFLILQYIPWFALGISIYLASSRHGTFSRRGPALTASCAILSLLIVDAFFLAALAATLGSVAFLAASGHATWLRHRILVWLGTISYPLYLLHENIGWSLLLQLGRMDVPIDLAILLVLAVSLAMASALNRWLERPALLWIRNRYRQRLASRQ